LFVIIDDYVNWLYRKYDAAMSGDAEWEIGKTQWKTEGELSQLWKGD